MSTYAEMRAALEARLETVTGIPDADHRATENDGYESTVGEVWLESRMGYAEERLISMPAIGGTLQQDGTWRLLLHFALDDGHAAADVLAQAVVGAFPAGLTLTNGGTTVRIDSSRRWGGGRDIDPLSYTVPVDIRWHVFTTNPLT